MRWLWRAQGGMCCHCRSPVENPDVAREKGWSHRGRAPSLEHVKPRSRGGSNRLENLLLAHEGCNQRRGTRALSATAKQMHQTVLAAVAAMRDRENAAHAVPAWRKEKAPARV